MKKLKVFIIILHYGKIEFTINCLKSLKKVSEKGLDIKTMVICNTLINQSEKKQLMSLADDIIQNKKNLGFAAGNNIGIRKALKNDADYILLLNNDTVVYKNFLPHLIKVAEEYLDIGIVGPTIKHKVKSKTFYDYGGTINWKLGKPFHINKTSRKDKKLKERDFVSGCCMLIKKDVFEKIGFLNESYFLYLEDVEFCVKGAKAGFTILLNPKSCIFHYGSGTSKSEVTKIFYSLRNSLKFTHSFVPLRFKPAAFAYNLLFYSAIFLKWQGSRSRRKIQRLLFVILQKRNLNKLILLFQIFLPIFRT